VDLNRLRHFLAVAEELHFGAAARKLGMEQPGVSLSIAALEKSIGVKLLERSSRSVMLTPAGEVLVEDAKHLLQQSDQAAERALTLMTLVAEEFGVALVHETACASRVAGVKFVRIAEACEPQCALLLKSCIRASFSPFI